MRCYLRIRIIQPEPQFLMDSVKKNYDMILRLALEGRQVMLWPRVYLDVSVSARPDSLPVRPIESWCACSHWLPAGS